MVVAIDQNDDLDPETLAKTTRYAALLKQIKTLTEERDTLKRDLSQTVSTVGEPDEDGHRYLDFGRPIGDYTGFQWQRRVSRTLDEDAALSLLIHRGLEDRCIEHRPEVIQDEVMACVAEGLLSEEDLDVMFPPKVSFAFCTVKAK